MIDEDDILDIDALEGSVEQGSMILPSGVILYWDSNQHGVRWFYTLDSDLEEQYVYGRRHADHDTVIAALSMDAVLDELKESHNVH